MSKVDDLLDEGAECPLLCGGRLVLEPPENCSCHISPPCSACESQRPECNSCDWIVPDIAIKTSFEHPPIPFRENDWCAWIEGEEEAGLRGWGRSEEAAIRDLLQEVEISQ